MHEDIEDGSVHGARATTLCCWLKDPSLTPWYVMKIRCSLNNEKYSVKGFKLFSRVSGDYHMKMFNICKSLGQRFSISIVCGFEI